MLFFGQDAFWSFRHAQSCSTIHPFEEETHMKKKKFTRILSFALALTFLVSGATLSVAADSAVSTNVTEKSINDYIDKLGTISYEEYLNKYRTPDVPNAAGTYRFDATENWVYSGSEKEDEKAKVGTFDGKSGLWTSDVGKVTWTFDLNALGITGAATYSIDLEYYAPSGKSASVEREFYVNGEAPFTEARALTLSKRWKSYQADGKSLLTASYVPASKKVRNNPAKLLENLNGVMEEAKALGINCWISEKSDCLYLEQPEFVTAGITSFLDKYEIRFFVTDAEQNELRPTMVQCPSWMTASLRDSGGYYSEDFVFVLEPDEDGKVSFTLNGVNEAVVISAFTIRPVETVISYENYLESLKTDGKLPADGSGVVRIEGEYTTSTSTNSVYPVEDRSSALTSPVDTTRTMLNTIGTEKWETAGQWLEYGFSVDASGMYDMYARFKQSYLEGMYVCRMMQIFTEGYEDEEAYKAAHGGSSKGYYNGLPFAEASKLRFDYGTDWKAEKIGDGDQTFRLYFEKGERYTVRFEVALGSMSQLISKVETILNALNDDYLDIIKLTGSSPDDYRDYSFFRLLPDTMKDMIVQGRALAEVSAFLKESAGVASTYSGICDKLSNLLAKMGHDEDAIAKNLTNFKSYVGSLGTFLTDAKTQPLQLDYIQIQNSEAKAPKAKANFFRTVAHEISNFIQSFFRDYNNMGAMESDVVGKSGNSVSVWLAYGRDQSQVIRNLCTNQFTPDSKITVDLKLITGGTLLPSILAGMGPDVYLGLAQETVINYAIRGALANIENMDGFDEIAKNFNEAAMMVLGTEDADGELHYYGLPENQSFPMMFVRLDILADLGLEIPKTWEDMYVAQSKLKSNNMEIGVTTDYKIFLYQMNGELFADNGMRINLDSVVGLKSFETMCNMFTQYSFPYKYDAANRFRTGEMPVIISDYISLYNKLKVFATELDGCWCFVPVPGYEQADGTINNMSVSTVTAAVMIKKSENQENAWEFMKWYTDAYCQKEYANEMVSIIGDSAKHSTANREAMESMPWTHDEYVEVAKQFDNLASIPNYPGYYILGRYTEFAFLSAYNDQADPSSELLSYINIVNKEITRKREEFHLETLPIGTTLAEKRTGQFLTAVTALEKLVGENSKYESAVSAANYAVANDKTQQLREVSDRFDQLLKADWDGKSVQITKVDGTVAEVPSYYVNVGKQSAETKNGGYKIGSLDEKQLVYFISVCLADIANALESYH